MKRQHKVVFDEPIVQPLKATPSSAKASATLVPSPFVCSAPGRVSRRCCLAVADIGYCSVRLARCQDSQLPTFTVLRRRVVSTRRGRNLLGALIVAGRAVLSVFIAELYSVLSRPPRRRGRLLRPVLAERLKGGDFAPFSSWRFSTPLCLSPLPSLGALPSEKQGLKSCAIEQSPGPCLAIYALVPDGARAAPRSCCGVSGARCWSS